jgi:hypothetical protein
MKLESTSKTARCPSTESVSPNTMADPPTTNHIADSKTAVAATSADNMTESTNAQSGVALETASIEPTPFAQSNTPTSTISTAEQEAAPAPTSLGTADLNTLEANLWPRLRLLGLPRELRDKIGWITVTPTAIIREGSPRTRSMAMASLDTMLSSATSILPGSHTDGESA